MAAFMKKMPFPVKKDKAPMPPKELNVELEVGSEEEPEAEGEAPEELDLKSMVGEEEGEEEVSPLADVSDEELMDEMKKRGLAGKTSLPAKGSDAPEASMPKFK